uniref:Uncharacterized protein n=1 Tax=Physcomitrium patens TaxID=3218 RepID=A0A2K1L3L0_PHYPA|nr:hypothetical protein PHYPA_003408 [Physcomitrium patens]
MVPFIECYCNWHLSPQDNFTTSNNSVNNYLLSDKVVVEITSVPNQQHHDLIEALHISSVKSLDASGNHLPGGFQVNITRLTSMSELELSNLIRAKIFSAVGNYKTVEMLWLSCMRLEGTIPSDLCNHTKLVEIVSEHCDVCSIGLMVLERFTSWKYHSE